MIHRDGFPVEINDTVRGFIHAGDTVEGRGFSGAVGADQRDDLPLVHFQAQVVDRHHAAELHGDVCQAKNILPAGFIFAHLMPH